MTLNLQVLPDAVTGSKAYEQLEKIKKKHGLRSKEATEFYKAAVAQMERINI